MRLSINKMCRGQGVAYLLAKVSGARETKKDFSAQSERGVALPLESYRISIDGDVAYFVLATPLLDTKDVVVCAKEVDAAGNVVCEKTRAFSRGRIKWSSRLFYKLDSEQAHHLRDIDRFTYSNQIHINPLYCTLAKETNELVVKGVICCPDGETSPTLRLLGYDGEEVGSFCPYLQRPQRTTYEGVPRIETSFTVRIPDDGKTYCLVADGSDGCRSGFMCFDLPSRGYYSYKHIPQYYRLADFDRWEPFVKERARRFELARPEDYSVENGPVFSLVVPLYHTPVRFFREMVDSVLCQLYQKWELVLVNSTPDDAALAKEISGLDDPRIKVVALESNLGIAANTNAGIDAASGDYIAFFDHDDVLDKLLLFRYAQAIAEDPSTDALYCDEDFLTEDGNYINPHFKSDLNIDLLRCHNYITHLLAVRVIYAKSLRLRSEFDGAQDYDFLLRLVERTQNFVHVHEVLYHWRMSDSSTAKDSGNKSYAAEAGLRALREHVGRAGLSATVDHAPFSCFYRTSYHVEGSPLVSIVIPNKDSVEVLSRCLESIEEKTTYKNYEIVVVENNSEEDATFEFYRTAEQRYGRLRVVRWPAEFNYSKINNFGVEQARGDYILLLNNDVEVISPSWLESMLGFCQREDVGAVGARLLYPDNTVQHAGVGMIYCKNRGEMGGPVHVFCHLDRSDPGYMNRAVISQDVTIVTGACLMTKRSVYEELGGLTERYSVAYNDVDFCLKVQRSGRCVVFDAEAELYHYESFSRGSDEVGDKVRRFVSEQGMLRHDWPECFYKPDPYYSKYLMW